MAISLVSNNKFGEFVSNDKFGELVRDNKFGELVNDNKREIGRFECAPVAKSFL